MKKSVMNIRTLKQVQNFLDEIPYINFGGCGIAAMAIYLWLEKQSKLNKKTHFIYVYNSGSDYYTNMAIANGESNENPDAPYHAVVYHNEKFIDSEGEYIIKETYVQNIHDIEFVRASVNNVCAWNDAFNRYKNVGHIEKTLGIELNINKENAWK